MTTTTCRGVVRGGVVVLDKETPLTEDTEVLVTPVAGARGSGAAIVAALERAPIVPAEWVDELEQRIAARQQPPAPPAQFPDGPSDQENG